MHPLNGFFFSIFTGLADEKQAASNLSPKMPRQPTDGAPVEGLGRKYTGQSEVREHDNTSQSKSLSMGRARGCQSGDGLKSRSERKMTLQQKKTSIRRVICQPNVVKHRRLRDPEPLMDRQGRASVLRFYAERYGNG